MQETVSKGEISRRIVRFQELLAAQGVGLALIRQPADLYYYTGTVADGFLAVPVEVIPLMAMMKFSVSMHFLDLTGCLPEGPI